MQRYSEWILCPSKSFPGKFYYFNVRNGKAAWGPGDAEITAGSPPETPKETENHNHLKRNSPPAPDLLQHDFFVSSLRQTPETRHEVTPFTSKQETPEPRQVTPISSIHHSTTDLIRQNFSSFSSMHHSTPVFGQKTFPQGLPKHKDSNVSWTPIQIQLHIPLQNQTSSTFGAEYSGFRDQPNISNADGSQVSQSTPPGFKYIVTRDFDTTESKEIIVDASSVPMHQRFVNFEAPGICFSKVNKDNIKRLHQKLQTSTPIKKSRAVDDMRLSNKPKSGESKSRLHFADFKSKTSDFNLKTGNSVMKEPVLNFGLFSKTNKEDMSLGLPRKIQEQKNQDFNVGPRITTDPACNGGLLTKSRKPLLSNGLPSKSLNFEPPQKTKEPYVHFGPSKITEPLFNLEPNLKTKDPVVYFEPPQKTKQPILNARPHCQTSESVFNFDPPLKVPYVNLGPETKEPSNQYLNIGPSLKSKEPLISGLPLETNEPVLNGKASKEKKPSLNGLPSETTEKETKKEPKSVLKGCVKSLKSCIKGDKGDNAAAKSFDDDLRAILISKRKSQDFSKVEGSKPKMPKKETPVKKVSFNLDHESISMVSSLEDDEDMKCAFIELYRPTVSYLRALGAARGAWYLLADTEALTKEIDFIDAFVQIEPTCRLLIPPVLHSWLLALARGCDRPRATAARNVLRRTTSSHVVVQPCGDQDNGTCTNDDILRCCVENMDQNNHLVLISDDLELLTTAKCYPIHCYSMNSIKNGLPATKPLQYKKDMKITISNDSKNIKNDSVIANSAYNIDLNEKEKALIRNLQMSNYPIGQNPNLKEKKQHEQNENPNGKIQNGQSGTEPNENDPLKYFYHDENMRIANAIEMYHTDSENRQSGNISGITNETHDISNISTIQNESMDIEKSFRSMEIDKSIVSIDKENSNKVTKTADVVWRFESETTKTSLEDDFKKCNIKEIETPLNSGETVSEFFKNQKPVDLQKFKYAPKLKISFQNNKTLEIPEENNNQKEKEKQKVLKNKDPRLETRKGNDSIFEFCKEKTKEPPRTEFENGKTNMASQSQKTLFEFENGKSFMASQYDRTKFEDQNEKTNMSSQLDRKSNMASTSNGFDVSKPQTIRNKIDLKRFHVNSRDMEQRVKARMDEWACFYWQVMEESLTVILQKHPPPLLAPLPPAPWSLLEALRCVDTLYQEQPTVRKVVTHLSSCLYDTTYKIKKYIHPEEFMRALGCGAKLLEYLEIIFPSIDIQDGVSALQTLLSQIEDDSDPTAGLSEPLLTASFNSKADELDARQNFVKDKSEVAEYLKKHFAAWKNYDPSQDFKVSRIRGKKEIKLDKITKVGVQYEEAIDRNGKKNVTNSTKTKNVRKYGSDVNNDDDINLFGLDGDKSNVVGKENYDKNKTGVVNKKNKYVENDIDVYKPKKAKVRKVQEKEPTIVRNVGVVKEFETKVRKKKTKPVNVDIKTVKKPKIDVKTARSGKINKIEKKYVNGNPKYAVYRPEEDPKLIYSPKVVIKANLISDYEEKMRLKKAKKLKTEYNDNHSTKIVKKHNKHSLNSYNGINNNQTLTNNHKQSDTSDNNQITKINKKKKNHNDNNDPHNDDNNNHNEDNDNNVTTDSGLGNELPRWSSVVDSYTAQIEKSLTFILTNMDSALGASREAGGAESLRMRAFEMDYLTCRTLDALRSLLHRADEDERAASREAVSKYMAQAKSTHNLVNTILSVTNYVLPASSDLS